MVRSTPHDRFEDAQLIAPDDVDFDPDGLHDAWVDADGVPARVAAQLVNTFAVDADGNAFGLDEGDGMEVGGSVHFLGIERGGVTYDVLVEPKAVDVVDLPTNVGRSKKIAFRDRDGVALYVNPDHIFVFSQD